MQMLTLLHTEGPELYGECNRVKTKPVIISWGPIFPNFFTVFISIILQIRQIESNIIAVCIRIHLSFMYNFKVKLT